MQLQYSESRGILGRFSSTAQQRLDEYGHAAYFSDTGKRAIFSENFSSIRSALSSPLVINLHYYIPIQCLHLSAFTFYQPTAR